MYYCNRGGSGKKTLHINDIRTIGAINAEARNAEEVKRIIAETGVTGVMFARVDFPLRAVDVTSPKLDGYIRKLFRPVRSTEPVARPLKVNTDYSDIDEIIDR